MRKIIVSILLVMTVICSCSGKSETALDWFNKAAELNYTDPRVIEYLNNAIKLQPNYASAYNMRGISYTRLGQYQRAIEDFNQAIVLKPDDAKTYINRGIAYTFLLQYQRAIVDYNKAISSKPDDVNAYYNREYVYFKQGNKKLGCRDAKNAFDVRFIHSIG
ncbi:MAG: tetratricopeptide repeat protein [Smithella sp.]